MVDEEQAAEVLSSAVDLEDHGRKAVAEYLKSLSFYDDLAQVSKRIIEECLREKDIKVQSVDARAKSPESFRRKSSLPSDLDRTQPKYPNPMKDIKDLAAVRVITYFRDTLNRVDDLLSHEFDILERSDKGAALLESDRFGYQSIHYVVRIRDERATLPEYSRYRLHPIEIQVRTVLQHAWAEIEHDIQYKSSYAIPTEIRRRFIALAGLLEIADREFASIQEADRDLTSSARKKVKQAELSDVEITPDALKTYLDKKLGADRRISEFSYDWMLRLLKKLGFSTLEQVEQCIKSYDDDRVNNALMNSRPGQTTRFENLVLAGMGSLFPDRLYKDHRAAHQYAKRKLLQLEQAGIEIGSYDPLADGL